MYLAKVYVNFRLQLYMIIRVKGLMKPVTDVLNNLVALHPLHWTTFELKASLVLPVLSFCL